MKGHKGHGGVTPTTAVYGGWWYPAGMSWEASEAVRAGRAPEDPQERAWLKEARIWLGEGGPQSRTGEGFEHGGWLYPAGMLLASKRDVLEGRPPSDAAEREWLRAACVAAAAAAPAVPSPAFVCRGYLYPEGASPEAVRAVRAGNPPPAAAEATWLRDERVWYGTAVPDGLADRDPVRAALCRAGAYIAPAPCAPLRSLPPAAVAAPQRQPTAASQTYEHSQDTGPDGPAPAPVLRPMPRHDRVLSGAAPQPRAYANNKPRLPVGEGIAAEVEGEKASLWLYRLEGAAALADLQEHAAYLKAIVRLKDNAKEAGMLVKVVGAALRLQDEANAPLPVGCLADVLRALNQKQFANFLLGQVLSHDAAAPDEAGRQRAEDALRILVAMLHTLGARGGRGARGGACFAPEDVLKYEARYRRDADVAAVGGFFEQVREMVVARGGGAKGDAGDEEEEEALEYVDVDVASFNDIFDPAPELRAAIVDRAVPSLAWHFNTQFRLMREDFLIPLRHAMQNLGKARTRGVWFAQEVTVIGIGTCRDGIVYQFRAPTHKRRWQKDRLKTGSLLCFSDAKFAPETLLWGTAALRPEVHPDYVDFAVRFDGLQADIIGNTYDMVESKLFFEAYRHVLKVLQRQDLATLPFKGVLAGDPDALAAVPPPAYLRHTPLVLNSLLCHPLLVEGEELWCVDEADEAGAARVPFPTDLDILLDPTQLSCVQAALTHEVAVIQGPPGTGKSFVGSRICRVLLDTLWGLDRDREHVTLAKGVSDEVRWDVDLHDMFDHDDRAPILVLCYTNHALDSVLKQLLECEEGDKESGDEEERGLPIEDRVVRLGSRSKEPSVAPYALESILRTLPREQRLRLLYRDLGNVRRDVADLSRALAVPQVLAHNETQLPPAAQAFFAQEKDRYRRELGRVNEEVAALRQRARNMDCGEARDELRKKETRQRQLDFCIKNAVQVWLQGGVTTDAPLDDDDDHWGMSGQDVARVATTDAARAPLDIDWAKVNYGEVPLAMRQEFFDIWTAAAVGPLKARFVERCIHFEAINKEVEAVRRDVAKKLLKTARVVGATTTGCAKYSDIVMDLAPQVVIVEEAAEVLESHILATLTPSTQHLILIGDHKQLQPKVNEFEVQEKGLSVSIMERLVLSGLKPSMLLTQRRMVDPICRLTSYFYSDPIETHPCTLRLPTRVKGLQHPLFFFSHPHPESKEDGESPYNAFEAEFAVQLAAHLMKQGYRPDQVVVLVPYRGQYHRVRDLQYGYSDPHGSEGVDDALRKVRVTTIDNYQGEESDIVILSLVRSHGHGFLKQENRLIVALSRARWGMYVIGNMDFIRCASPEWNRVYTYASERGLLGGQLVIECKRHDTRAPVTSPNSFWRLSPRGGCGSVCNTRLQCGHTCKEGCHADNYDHAVSTCVEQCERVGASCVPPRECDHPCRKPCRVPCGMCEVPVVKELLCGHSHPVPCGQDVADATCLTPCEKVLACGHQCSKRCSQECKCTTKVQRSLSCGHEASAECSKPVANIICKERCQFVMSCDHRCSRRCVECQKRGTLGLHECREDCNRVLLCGHTCQSTCSKMCPPCKQETCVMECAHSSCGEPCGVPCVPCASPCDWQCEHHACGRKCWEVCDRPRCDERCTKLLACGHRCRGVCGDPCPQYCAEEGCQYGEVEDLLMVGEFESTDLMVQFPCKHVFEVTAFDAYVSAERSNAKVSWLKCPTCKAAITPKGTGRYRVEVTQRMQDVNKAKQLILDREMKYQAGKSEAARRLEALYGGVRFLPLEQRELQREREFLSQRLKQCSFDDFPAVAKQLDLAEYWKEERARLHGAVLQGCVERLGALVHEALATMMTVEALDRAYDRIAVLMLQGQAEFIAAKLRENRRLEDAQELLVRAAALRPDGRNDPDAVRVLREDVKRLAPQVAVSTREELRIISKALDLGPGHFFKCPNGHLYVIADCGGAVTEARCHECGTAIGGANHALRDDNAFAGDLIDDEAKPQWPHGYYDNVAFDD